MPSAPNTIRWDVASTLITRIRTALSTVQVEAGFPGDALKDEAIWIDELDGDVHIPVMTGGRKHRDDKFTVPFEIRVAGKKDLDTTMDRLSALVAAIEDIAADDPDLSGMDGLIDVEVTSERMTAGQIRNTGWIGFGEVVISCHARYE